MTRKQKGIIAALALANVVVILTVVVVVARSSGAQPSRLPHPHTRTPPRPHTPTPLHSPTSTPSQRTCQWQATQLLSQAGLGGTVALTLDGPLCFEITYPLAPGQATPESMDEAAQLVWTVFDVALALQEDDECVSFTQVEVTILASNSQAETRISASVDAADLAAFSAGELSEDEFIERVAYTTNTKRKP